MQHVPQVYDGRMNDHNLDATLNDAEVLMETVTTMLLAGWDPEQIQAVVMVATGRFSLDNDDEDDPLPISIPGPPGPEDEDE